MEYKQVIANSIERNRKRLKYTLDLGRRTAYLKSQNTPVSSTNEMQLIIQSIERDAQNLQMINENIGSKKVHDLLSEYNARISSSTDESEKRNLLNERDSIIGEKEKQIQLQQNYKELLKSNYKRLKELIEQDPKNIINSIQPNNFISENARNALQMIDTFDKKTSDEIKNLTYQEIKNENEKLQRRIENKFEQLVVNGAINEEDYIKIDGDLDDVNRTYDLPKKYLKLTAVKDKVNQLVNKYLMRNSNSNMSAVQTHSVVNDVGDMKDLSEWEKSVSEAKKKGRPQVEGEQIRFFSKTLDIINAKKNENIDSFIRLLASKPNFDPNDANIVELINSLNMWANTEEKINNTGVNILTDLRKKIDPSFNPNIKRKVNEELYDVIRAKVYEQPKKVSFVEEPQPEPIAEQAQPKKEQTLEPHEIPEEPVIPEEIIKVGKVSIPQSTVQAIANSIDEDSYETYEELVNEIARAIEYQYQMSSVDALSASNQWLGNWKSREESRQRALERWNMGITPAEQMKMMEEETKRIKAEQKMKEEQKKQIEAEYSQYQPKYNITAQEIDDARKDLNKKWYEITSKDKDKMVNFIVNQRKKDGKNTVKFRVKEAVSGYVTHMTPTKKQVETDESNLPPPAVPYLEDEMRTLEPFKSTPQKKEGNGKGKGRNVVKIKI